MVGALIFGKWQLLCVPIYGIALEHIKILYKCMKNISNYYVLLSKLRNYCCLVNPDFEFYLFEVLFLVVEIPQKLLEQK